MPFTFGRNLKFGLTPESTYNTYVAPGASKGIAILEGGFTPNIAWMEMMTALSIPEKKITDLVAGPRNLTARIRCKLPKEGFGQLLKNAYGSVTDTAVGVTFSGTKHTFSASNTTPTSISLLLSDDIQAYRLSGCAVKTLRLIGEVGQPIIAEMDFIGGTWALAASGVGSMTVPTTASTINPFWHTNNITDVQANAAYTAFRWEFALENAYADGLAESYEIQTTTALNNARKQLERAGDVPIRYTFTFERLYQSNAKITDYTDQASSFLTSIELKETATSTDISTSTNDYYMKITAATCFFKQHTLDKSSDLFKETVVVEGYQNASSDNQFIYKDKQSVS